MTDKIHVVPTTASSQDAGHGTHGASDLIAAMVSGRRAERDAQRELRAEFGVQLRWGSEVPQGKAVADAD